MVFDLPRYVLSECLRFSHGPFQKTILPFHFYGTAVLCNIICWLSIYVLFREEAIEDYVRENYEHLNAMRNEPQTMEEMIDGVEHLMTLCSIMGFVTYERSADRVRATSCSHYHTY